MPSSPHLLPHEPDRVPDGERIRQHYQLFPAGRLHGVVAGEGARADGLGVAYQETGLLTAAE